MTRLPAYAAASFGALLAAAASPASAVVVTVTSGPNPGIVFDSGGFESETLNAFPSQSSPAGSSYSLPLFGSPATNTSNSVTVTGSIAGGPTAAYAGNNYLAINRTNSTIGLGANFSRSIDLATESFTFEYAFWGTTNSTAFAIGNNIAGATVGTAGVLAGWRYNPTPSDLTQYLNPMQTTDELQSLTYKVNDWNTLIYRWDAQTQAGTYILNGETAAAAPRFATGSAQAAPTQVNRFFASSGAANTSIWIDAVPEPSSLTLVGIGAMAALRRRRRRA